MSDMHDESAEPLDIGRRWNKLAAVGALTAVAGAGVVLFAINTSSASAAADPKVTLCHATDSNTNPYVEITVAAAGAFNGHLKKHTGPIWDPSLKAQHIKWGDIIPPFTYKGNLYSANWPDGSAIFDNGCAIPQQQTGTPTPTASISASSSTITSEPPITQTVTQTVGTEPTSTAVPAAVAAGRHTPVSGTSVTLGGALMALGLGGLLTAVRPWKRGAH